jgi:hypothetical protein
MSGEMPGKAGKRPGCRGNTLGMLFLMAGMLPNPEFQRARNLDEILTLASQYCHRLETSVLDFVCLEEVEETVFIPFRFRNSAIPSDVQVRRIVYDYQFVRKESIVEKRVPRQANGITHETAVAEKAPVRIYHSRVVFGPIGLLGSAAQAKHSYRIVGREKLWDEEVVKIEAVPKNVAEADWLWGTAWIEPSTGAVLKIEWEARSIGNFQWAQEEAGKINAVPMLSFVSEYGFQNNGLRFPSQFSAQESYRRRNTRSSLSIVDKSTTMVEYKDYRFFTVGTEVVIKHTV